MLEKQQLETILATALGEGGDFAELFMERKTNTGISCEDNRIEKIISGIELGAGIRVIVGENTAYGYTNDLSLEGLLEVARVVAKAAKGAAGSVKIELKKAEPPVAFEVRQLPTGVSIDEKVRLVEAANEAARALDERVIQVAVAYGDVIQDVWIANSLGRYVEDRRIRTRFVVNVVAAENGLIQTGYEAIGGHVGFELFDEVSPVELAKKAAQRALLMLRAKPAPAGQMMVVMSGEAGGTMIHEACGHGLEADLVQKQLSVYRGKIGQKVASELVTVIDDATLPNKYGSFAFDDEGNPAQRTVLIENGILKGYMYDYLTAKKEGKTSTGNGRRESFRDRPIVRMTNTFIAPGNSDPEEIIRSVQKGFYVKKMGGGQVNTTNGDFVFDVTEGYLIENGKITEPVRGATLTGNGPRVLQMIDMVGNDHGFAIGTCGKDGQGVPVSDAQPTIRIPQLTIGGLLD
ncbi:MAG TPA: TldD/PmbA family protein [Clostridia bacterium]|nr:TldD/PmbA family protein [Clostridia bacterium]